MKEAIDFVSEVNEVGFECAVAIATEAEVQAGAACGQMCLVTDAIGE